MCWIGSLMAIKFRSVPFNVTRQCGQTRATSLSQQSWTLLNGNVESVCPGPNKEKAQLERY